MGQSTFKIPPDSSQNEEIVLEGLKQGDFLWLEVFVILLYLAIQSSQTSNAYQNVWMAASYGKS